MRLKRLPSYWCGIADWRVSLWVESKRASCIMHLAASRRALSGVSAEKPVERSAHGKIASATYWLVLGGSQPFGLMKHRE
jgi:hypothetical protein